MKMLSLLLSATGALVYRAAAAEARHDISALVQGSVRMHRADAEGEESRTALSVGSYVEETKEGPVANTKLGPVVGLDQEDHNLFAGIPYVETPERFEVGQPKKPWAPATFDAKKFGKPCIGSQTERSEDEDCLNLNMWIPKGGHTNMPVIVYFHGGINQHGSGSEGLRRGDGIVINKKYPTIFINFNFRLGIFGWIYLPSANVSQNLGMRDQQAALRWVQTHIAAFGGDPGRVTLQGQSEGCGSILAHMVSPGSAGLFHRAAWHSPVLDFWSRSTNQDRSKFMIEEAGCGGKSPGSTLRCLRRKPAKNLWSRDWVAESLSRGMLLPDWDITLMKLVKYGMRAKDKVEVLGQLGWHAVEDNVTFPGEPRDLIKQGRFHKVPLLMTISKNESYGVIPHGIQIGTEIGIRLLLDDRGREGVKDKYRASLEARGIHVTDSELGNMILTDKIWTCDVRSLAQDITEAGGRAYVGMFWHSPRFDPVGKGTSAICQKGATCHAAEMLYVLPQGHGRGIHGKGMEEEQKFAETYSQSFLAFVHGKDGEHPWKAWDSSKPMTFYDSTGTWVMPNYRHEQCDILDKSVGSHMPTFMKLAALAANSTANGP